MSVSQGAQRRTVHAGDEPDVEGRMVDVPDLEHAVAVGREECSTGSGWSFDLVGGPAAAPGALGVGARRLGERTAQRPVAGRRMHVALVAEGDQTGVRRLDPAGAAVVGERLDPLPEDFGLRRAQSGGPATEPAEAGQPREGRAVAAFAVLAPSAVPADTACGGTGRRPAVGFEVGDRLPSRPCVVEGARAAEHRVEVGGGIGASQGTILEEALDVAHGQGDDTP